MNLHRTNQSTQAADFLADAAVQSDNPRVFLAQIQKRIAGGSHD